jgi:NAD(P)-dependent dehydrogenase (short-subunit alcohol dehydrogenase family)
MAPTHGACARQAVSFALEPDARGFELMRQIGFALVFLALLPFGAGAAQFAADAPTVLITGANRGMGFELARQYAERGWNVIATARRPADDPGLTDLRALAAKHANVALERIDVTDTGMIRGVAAKYRDQPIDVLINNAAAVEDTFAADMKAATVPYDQIDYDAARHDFDVNALGAMRMVQAFSPNVERSRQKKIATITSLAGSFTRGLPGATAMNYSASKAALNKYMVMLAYAVKPKGIVVGLFEPIFVASKRDMKGMKGAAPVDQEVGKLIKLIDALAEDRSGKITNFSTGQIDPF